MHRVRLLYLFLVEARHAILQLVDVLMVHLVNLEQIFQEQENQIWKETSLFTGFAELEEVEDSVGETFEELTMPE